MERLTKVYESVEKLYLSESTPPLGRWMWNNHVNWVKDRAQKLAEKYQAEEEKVMASALLHDLADSEFERGHVDADAWGEAKAREILKDAGFTEEEAHEIQEIIIKPHSCRPGNMPTTTEGKVLATADALFHIQTSFFALLCYKNRPQDIHSFEEWREWFLGKIDRDFKTKIFFEDEKKEAEADYDALVTVFGNTSLSSEE